MRELTLQVPGDKSISHRAVLYAGLATGVSRMSNLADGRDVRSSLRCMEGLGVSIERTHEEVRIHGRGLHGLSAPDAPLDCGNSGTTMRLLSGILAGQPFHADLIGDASLSRRPMQRVMEPLRRMGATFEDQDTGTAPFRITGRRPTYAIDYTLPVASAQVKSAVLLSALFSDGTTTVREESITRDHTERMFPVIVSETKDQRVLTVEPPSGLEPLRSRIPGDPSSAAFLVMATLLQSEISVLLEYVSANPTRTAYMDVLRALGASIELEAEGMMQQEPYANLRIRPSTLSGEIFIGKNIAPLIDEIPMLSVLAACTGIPCTVRNAEELRRKESDRIGLLVRNLDAIGCDVEEYPDGFASVPKNGLIGAMIETQGDHRIAMAFGVAGLVLRGMMIDTPSCVDISFPGFWNALSRFER